MNRRLESFHSLLKGGTPDRVIWTADITYWIEGMRVRGSANPSWSTEKGYLELCRELRIMPYYWYDKFWLGEPVYDDTVRVTVEARGTAARRSWVTSAGTLTEELTFMKASSSSAHTLYPVADRRDLDVFLYLLEHRELRPSNIEDYLVRVELWKTFDGIPSIAMPRSPLASFFYEWAGVENAVYLMVDYPGIIRKIFSIMDRQEEPIIDAVCRLAPPVVHFADNLSGDNFTGLYDDFMRAGHRKRIQRFHDAGIACAVHLDGKVSGLLPKLAAAGFDAIEALTPEPGGDLPVEMMREIAQNNRVILWGGIPGILFAPPYTWKDMRAHVHRVLDTWKGTPFILGVADQVPPDGDIDFCRRIADLIEL